MTLPYFTSCSWPIRPLRVLGALSLAVASWSIASAEPTGRSGVAPVVSPEMEDGDAKRLLAASDEVRNPPGDFFATITLSEYRRKKLSDSSTVDVYAKQAGDLGQANNLVRFTAPKHEMGKLVLRNGMEVWFYDPATKASIRLSPQARLLGLASVGDVMSTRFAKSYDAKIVARETTEDDARKLRKAVKLRLSARRQDVPYALIDYWIEDETHRPIKAQFFTEEGRLLKSAYFRRYRPVMGRERPTETIIIDGLDPSWITVVRQGDVRPKQIPQNWFQRGYLPHIVWEE